MTTEIQIQNKDENNHINCVSFALIILQSCFRGRTEIIAGTSDDEVGEEYIDEQKMKECDQLLEAARNGDHVLAIQLLQSNPNLMLHRDYMESKRKARHTKGDVLIIDSEMRLATMGLRVKEVEEKYTKGEKKKGCQLHKAARNGDHVLALQLLQSDPHLMFYSVDGNTVLHVTAMHGNRFFVMKLIEFIKEKPLVFESKNCPFEIKDDDGDTILHLALKFKHEELASDLIKELPDPNFVYEMNKNHIMPIMLAIRAGYSNLVEEMLKRAPWTSIPSHIFYGRHFTILHDAIDTNNLGMLQKILDYMPALAESVSPLIYAVNKGFIEAVQYFLNKFPNLVAECTFEDKFPIHEAIEVDNIDIVKEILSHYPEAMNQVYTNRYMSGGWNQVYTNRYMCGGWNQVYTNRYMCGGWRTLSYATYKGRLSIVQYMLTNYRGYATKADPDGSFPIHWTFRIEADESVEFVKKFITCVPETLYQVTERGHTILHLVVLYTRPEYLSYLKTLPDLNKIFHNKDVDGNTFLDLIKQEMENYYKRHPEAPKTIFTRMKKWLGSSNS